jgi:formylmethanofuran dehydrogenase subunit B|uniref:Formylmethanofuran dehydrogenase subunit B n=1 Tax=Desulfobacca acetoxidans TaxID=60893 RepID=A0A7C5EM98_9BACT
MTRESVVCPGCSCLCDDLDLTFENGRLMAVANVCRWGAGKFLATKKFHSQSPRARVSGFLLRRSGGWQTVRYEEALEEAGNLLVKARRPLIYGLTNCGVRTQEAALQLARKLGARLEPADLGFMGPYFAAVRNHGLFWASLEVIRDQADTVIFWGANPFHAAPRHLVRYAVFARGRFTERGLEDRRVAAVDLYDTELSHFCSLFVKTNPEQELGLAKTILDCLSGSLEGRAAVPAARSLADLMGRSTYGVIFAGRGVSYRNRGELFQTLAELTARLNRERPFALLPIPGGFNSMGLYHLLLRELGSPGAPEFQGGEVTTTLSPVDFREVDAFLVTGADLFWDLSEEQIQDLQRRQVPVVALSPFANRTTAQAAVLFPVALDGVEQADEAYRLDGLPLGLKAVTTSPWPGSHQILGDLALCC